MEERIAEMISERVDGAVERALFGTAATATDQDAGCLTSAKIKKAIKDCRKLKFNLDRTAVTIIVSLSHVGPIVRHEEPNQGTFVEMDFPTAQALHRESPIVLKEIIDEHTAHFRPAHQWDCFVSSFLSMPPYEVPETE